MKTYLHALALAIAALIVLAPVAAAATAVTVRIETPTKTLFNGVVMPKDVQMQSEIAANCAQNTYPASIIGVNALAALVIAGNLENLKVTGTGDRYSFGVLVCRIGSFAGDSTHSWMFKLNNDATKLPADTLKNGDEVLWYFGGINPDFSSVQTGTLDLNLAAHVRAGKRSVGRVWDYDNATGKRTTAAGAVVDFGGKKYKADNTGRVKLTAPRISGKSRNVLARATLTGTIPGSDNICIYRKRASDCKD